MTHDELLAKIDDELIIHGQRGNVVKHSFALRAVVELHKPARIGEGCSHCKMTAITSRPYPCPTIQAIEKELK
jgi:hypothetical protein